MLQHGSYYDEELYYAAASTWAFDLKAQRVKVSCGLIIRNAAGNSLNLERAVCTLFTSARQSSFQKDLLSCDCIPVTVAGSGGLLVMCLIQCSPEWVLQFTFVC